MIKEADQTKMEKITTSITQNAFLLGKKSGAHKELEVWAKQLFPVATEAQVINMEEV